jgi:hypothetical protein
MFSAAFMYTPSNQRGMKSMRAELVYSCCVRAAVDDPAEMERLVPEPRTLGYGVLIQVPEGLQRICL